MQSNYKPKSRQSDLVIQEIKSEILVYDQRINKAFCLNKTLALVWSLCDGERSAAAIGQIMSEKLKQPVTEDLIRLALDQLMKENLLEYSEGPVVNFTGLSRREAIRRAGFASMIALPVITSLIAPKAANAQSLAACPPFNSGPGSTGDSCDCPTATPQGMTCGNGGGNGGNQVGLCQNTCTCTAGTVIRLQTNTVIGFCS